VTFFRNLRIWVGRIPVWFWGQRSLWLPTAVLCGVPLIAIAIPLGQPELRIRYSGLVLELLGIITVIVGLRHKGRLFNKPSLRQRLAQAMQSFPSWPGRNRTVALSGVSISATAGVAGRLSAWHSATDTSLERRIAALEKNIESLKLDHAEAVKALRTADEQIRHSLESESTERKSVDADLKRKIDGIGGDGLHVEAMGIIWVVFGAILTTVSTELASLPWFS
jgi:hypothetical protein